MVSHANEVYCGHQGHIIFIGVISAHIGVSGDAI